MAKPQDPIVRLIAPGSVLGENCSVDPMAVPAGQFPLLQNLRLDGRVPTVRGGTRKLTAAVPVAGASFRGSWSGTLNGVNTIVCAYLVGGEVRVYSLAPGTWAWTELTRDGSAGNKMFGDSRLPGDTGFCCFCKVPLTRVGVTRDLLLISNPSSGYPRVYDPSHATAMLQMPKLNTLNACVPGTPSNYSVVASWPQCFDIGTTHGGEGTTGTADFKLQLNGAAPNIRCDLIWTNAGTPPLTAELHFGAGPRIDLRYSAQLIVRVQETVSHMGFVRSLQWQIRNQAGTTTTIYNPDGSTPALIGVPDSNQGCSNVVYYAANLAGLSAAALTNVEAFILILPATPAVGDTQQITMIAGSGGVPGLSNFAIAYRNEYSGVESHGRVIPSTIYPPITVELGKSLATAGSPIETIPASGLLYYTYTVTAENPNSGNTITGDLGINPTQADYYISFNPDYVSAALYVENHAADQWTGQISVGQPIFNVVIGAAANTTADATIPMPDAYQGYIPRPVCMMRSTSRLFMGGDYGYTADLYFSEDSFPLRFRPVARFLSDGSVDPSTGSRDTFNAPVMGIVPMGDVVNGVEFGVPVMIVWTTQQAYRLYGVLAEQLSAPVPLGPHGLANTTSSAMRS